MLIGNCRLLILLGVSLFLPASAYCQAGITYKYHFNGNLHGKSVVAGDRELLINYSISELTIGSLSNSSGDFYKISIPGHNRTSEPGKPELPVLSRLISVPENCDVSIHISDVKSQKINPSHADFKGILFPRQVDETKTINGHDTSFVIDKALYNKKELIGPDTVRIEFLGKVRKTRLSTLYISPVMYNPYLNELNVITSMKIEITFTPAKGSAISGQPGESALFAQTLDKGVLNYSSGAVIPDYTEKPVRMIILTDTTFKKNLEPFIQWKTQKGFSITTLYKGTGLAGNSFTEIKDKLKNIYNSGTEDNPAPEYLLIIGTTGKIPSSEGTSNTSDLYYGEFDGGGDFLPDMYIGRIPVADTGELKTVVGKLLQYEKFQFADTNKFFSRTMVTAGDDSRYVNYMNGQIKYADSYYLNPLNNIENHIFYYPKSATSEDTIKKLINEGLAFMNYSGHGDEYGWLEPTVKVPDITNMHNSNMYPFIISNACKTARYSILGSFGNRMVVSPDKGAVGYIGCTNDSYWDEDFYWAVGVGTPDTFPRYTETGLGALDRLFHKNNESPSDWYITMGQVNYSGNMAVSSSTSSLKKYYWETYALLGDPSVIPFIGKPDTFNINLPDTLPNGSRSLSLTIDPFAYLAVSHFDTLWDASFASPSGSVILDMPGLSNDSCLVVATGQNKKPLIKKIYFSEINKEFINMASSQIDDSTGNNNGRADWGESISLKVTISNLGLIPTDQLYAKISSKSDLVTIINDSVFIGTLAGRTDVVLSNDFGIKISEMAPDKEYIPINLKLRDSKTEKNYTIDICVHSPVLEILDCVPDDSESGNGNFIADPGETVKLVFRVNNMGSSNISGQFALTSPDENVLVLQPSVKSGVLNFGEVSEIPISVKVSESVLSGSTITVSASLECDPYFLNKSFTFRVGQLRETFESSSFKVFPWINSGAKPWIISQSGSIEGKLSAQSGAISDDQTSTLKIRSYYASPDSVSFYYKVSSEPNFDFLFFYLNGSEVFKKSGETSWERKVLAVPAGLNEMEWVYRKDRSIFQGSDCAWLDMIDFAGQSSVRYIRRDIKTARIVSPKRNQKSGNEPVTLKLLNIGPDTIKGFNLAYTINNGNPVREFFSSSLVPFGDSVSVTFNTRADLTRYGIYYLDAYGYENNDDYPLNDTLHLQIENTEITEPLRVFPNPFTDKLTICINSSLTGKAVISITNSAGIRLYSIEKELTKGVNEFDISNKVSFLVPSVYYLNIKGPDFNKSIPVIKVKQ